MAWHFTFGTLARQPEQKRKRGRRQPARLVCGLRGTSSVMSFTKHTYTPRPWQLDAWHHSTSSQLNHAAHSVFLALTELFVLVCHDTATEACTTILQIACHDTELSLYSDRCDVPDLKTNLRDSMTASFSHRLLAHHQQHKDRAWPLPFPASLHGRSTVCRYNKVKWSGHRVLERG